MSSHRQHRTRRAQGVALAPKVRRALRQVLLTVGAGLGLVAMLSAVAGLAFGVLPLVFRSGSMAPAFETGALGLAHETPAGEVRVGDVVSVHAADGTRITHRVTAAAGGPDGLTLLTLKGDANSAADATPYPVRTVDRVFLHVNGLGYGVAWLSSPVAMFLGGLFAAWLLMVAFRRRPVEPPAPVSPAPPGSRGSRGRRVSRGHRVRSMAGSARVGPVFLVLSLATSAALAGFGGRVDSTLAAWQDTGVATSGTFATDTMGAVTISCSGGGLLSSPTISWSTPATGPAPTSYLVSFTDGVTPQTASTTATSWQLPPALLSLLATYTITVQSVTANWHSVASNAKQVSVTNVLFIGLVTACL